MENSRTIRRLILISTLLVLSTVIAAGVYTQVSKSQKQKDILSTYDAAKVTAAPEVRSLVKGLDISSVSLIDRGTPYASIVIDVINQRDEDVMAVDFIARGGKSTSSGLAMDGLAEENNPLVIIPRHSLKTFTWNLGSILEGETIVLAVAVFSDGKEEGDARFLDRLKKGRIHYQESKRKEKANNGGPR